MGKTLQQIESELYGSGRTTRAIERGGKRIKPRIEDLNTFQITMLHMCRSLYGQVDCACYDKQHIVPSCDHLRNLASKVVNDVRLYDGRAKERGE
jgi:hypothetical protein